MSKAPFRRERCFLLSYPLTKGLRFRFDMLYKNNDPTEPPMIYPNEETDS